MERGTALSRLATGGEVQSKTVDDNVKHLLDGIFARAGPEHEFVKALRNLGWSSDTSTFQPAVPLRAILAAVYDVLERSSPFSSSAPPATGSVVSSSSLDCSPPASSYRSLSPSPEQQRGTKRQRSSPPQLSPTTSSPSLAVGVASPEDYSLQATAGAAAVVAGALPQSDLFEFRLFATTQHHRSCLLRAIMPGGIYCCALKWACLLFLRRCYQLRDIAASSEKAFSFCHPLAGPGQHPPVTDHCEVRGWLGSAEAYEAEYKWPEDGNVPWPLLVPSGLRLRRAREVWENQFVATGSTPSPHLWESAVPHRCSQCLASLVPDAASYPGLSEESWLEHIEQHLTQSGLLNPAAFVSRNNSHTSIASGVIS